MKSNSVSGELTSVLSISSSQTTLRLSEYFNSEDPSSALRKWVKQKQDEEKLRLGLSFSNLSVHGFISSDNYQSTFGSYFLEIPKPVLKPFRSRHHSKVQILHTMEGLVQSGEMLLVLGRPGSGCSTFLKTIAGDTHGFVVNGDSSVNYQGIPYLDMHKHCRAESVYVAEVDVHFPELQLGQTLAFAARARSTTSGSAKPAQDASRWAGSMFNLKDAFDTPMGNDMIRGVSGGEKKRASIAEAFMGGSKVQCWDQSTRGLDSSTALDLITILRDTADQLGSTVLASIYQASEDIYNNFDKVMVLYEGRQIFFGNSSTAVQYFTSMGFVKPPKSTSADFLTSLTNPSERVVASGYESQVPRTPDEFVQIWKQSLERGALSRDIEGFNEQYPVRTQNFKNYLQKKAEIIKNPKAISSPYTISMFAQVKLCLIRAFQRLANNSEPVTSGIIGNAIIGLVIGSVFYNLDNTSASIDSRALLLFFAVMLNACTSATEILSVWAQRPIVEKHARYAFYHPFSEAVASMVCDLPNKILASLVFNLAVYFLTNLRRTSGAFFIYYLFSFTALLTMSMIFRMIGSLFRSIEQSLAPGAWFISGLMLYTGFVVPIPYMVSWFSWFRWINPVFYAYESLMINEFRDRRFPCSQMIPSGPSYAGFARDSVICSSVGARPGDDFVEGNAYLHTKFQFSTDRIWRNLGFMIALVLAYCGIYLLAVEYIPTERSKGEILLFRRRDSSHKQAPQDEEAGTIGLSVIEDKCNGPSFKPPEFESRTLNKGLNFFHTSQRQTKILHWSDICYDIKVSKKKDRNILCGVDGWVKPGTLTALMGATGAGKTTLMDVLASRASAGVVTGDILIDGQPRYLGFQRQTGFVQQGDIHLSTATVREALTFSALLRQPTSYSKEEKLDYVEHVLNLLEMGTYADAVVGVPGEGLNIEQRRRLSIAIEMVARPELLLFLDEPTSGLDSQTAWSICMLLRKLADNGQAVLCTIHQPSAQLFEMFDQLLLLEKGQTLYFGEIGQNGTKMRRYFEKNGARTCKFHENPAEWMLDIIGATPRSDNVIPWAEVWNQSPEKRIVKEHLNMLASGTKNESEITALPEAKPTISNRDSGKYATPLSTQIRLVLYRTFQEYWRTPRYVHSKVVLCAGAALLNGLSFINTDHSIQGLTNIIFSIFLLTNIYTSVIQQLIPQFINSRTLYEAREMQSMTYSWIVFISSRLVVEIAWQTLDAVVIFVAWYYPVGLWCNGDGTFNMHERAGLAFLFLWFFCIFSSTFSYAISAAIEHAVTAVNITQLLFYLCVIFCGVIVQPDSLPDFWKFMYRISPLTYMIRGMVSASVGNTNITCSSTELLRILAPANTTCGEYLFDYTMQMGGRTMNKMSEGECLFCPITKANDVIAGFGVDVTARWVDFGIFTVYLVFNIAATFAFYWLVRVPRAKKA